MPKYEIGVKLRKGYSADNYGRQIEDLARNFNTDKISYEIGDKEDMSLDFGQDVNNARLFFNKLLTLECVLSRNFRETRDIQ